MSPLAGPLSIEPPAWFSSRAHQLNAGHLKLLWNGLSANTRSGYLSVQRNYEKHCALQNLSAWPASTQSLISWLTSRLLGNSNQKAIKPDTALVDLAALRAYHVDNFLDDKLFDNKHFRRLVDGARRLSPITKVRVRKPISREAITKLSSGLATLPLQSSEMTTDLSTNTHLSVWYIFPGRDPYCCFNTVCKTTVSNTDNGWRTHRLPIKTGRIRDISE